MTPNQELATLVAAAVVVCGLLLLMVIRGKHRATQSDREQRGL